MISAPGADFKSAVRWNRKKLFKFGGVLRVPYSVAHQNYAISEVSHLPCVQEPVGGRQSAHIVWVEGSDWFLMRSSPTCCCEHRGSEHNNQDGHLYLHCGRWPPPKALADEISCLWRDYDPPQSQARTEPYFSGVTIVLGRMANCKW